MGTSMSMSNDKTAGAFAERIALITGADGAIGSALVRALREQGATVVGADAAGAAAIENIASGLLDTVKLDVTDPDAIRALVNGIEQRVGTVDLLVNVAGVVSFGSAEALPVAEWDRVIDINLRGTFLACQAVIAGMKRKGF
ncbi:MAG: hypothetical protein JWQ11_3909, partial [Rhizobacter sp.]|nr:hypothetical protein [Rhizobacter sp.]